MSGCAELEGFWGEMGQRTLCGWGAGVQIEYVEDAMNMSLVSNTSPERQAASGMSRAREVRAVFQAGRLLTFELQMTCTVCLRANEHGPLFPTRESGGKSDAGGCFAQRPSFKETVAKLRTLNAVASRTITLRHATQWESMLLALLSLEDHSKLRAGNGLCKRPS